MVSCAAVGGVLTAAGVTARRRPGAPRERQKRCGLRLAARGTPRVFLLADSRQRGVCCSRGRAGLWTADVEGITIARVSVGIVALGYILFGHHAPSGARGRGVWALRRRSTCPATSRAMAAMVISAAATLLVVALGRSMDPLERYPLTDEAIVLNETIHQSTRLRIMTMLVGQPVSDRLTYGFIQQTLGLTGGNLTTHLRKLEDAGYLVIAKGVRRRQAAHLGTGHTRGPPRLCRIPGQPGTSAELATEQIAARLGTTWTEEPAPTA